MCIVMMNMNTAMGIAMLDSVRPGLLSLLRLVSPSLPVGAYAYSQGLEYAIDSGELKTSADVVQWVSAVLSQSQAYVDVPLFRCMYQSWQQDDAAQVQALSQELMAWRDSKEFRLEDRQQGQALARLLCDLGDAQAEPWLRQPYTSFAAMFALAAVKGGVSLNDAVHGLLWAWCENQVAAAIKLVPLGQTDGQRMLLQLQPVIAKAAEFGLALPYDDVGASLPGMSMVSAWHEQQYSRLFRS